MATPPAISTTEQALTESARPEHAAIRRRLQYLGEADARLSELKNRVRGAKHFIRRRDPDTASEELHQVINEARRLILHLKAWNSHVPEEPAQKPDAS